MPPRVTVLHKLIQVTLGGWPSQKSDTGLDVRAYYNVRHELTMQNGLVFKDNRIVVPTNVRKKNRPVPRSHQGIQGCIRRAKDVLTSDESATTSASATHIVRSNARSA